MYKARPRTLGDVLRSRVDAAPDETLYRFLESGDLDGQIQAWTSLDLFVRARAIGQELGERRLAGERVLLLFPPGLDFVAAFYGCLLSGVIAVPVYPPDPARLAQTLPKLQRIASNCSALAVLTTTSIAALSAGAPMLGEMLSSLPWIAVDAISNEKAEVWVAPALSPESIAFLQYTSGSTAEPKGVVLTHGQLLHNLAFIQNGFDLRPPDRVVSWLPLFHDMGLIGTMLGSLFAGVDCTFMSPIAFLQDPARWVRVMSRSGASVSGGPNFAFELCARKVSEQEAYELDLRNWRLAFNGAEPIRRETLERFHERFAASGFRRSAFAPCYGLAESALLVAVHPQQTPLAIEPIDRTALRDGRAVLAPSIAPEETMTVIASGKPAADVVVRIVAPDQVAECREGDVGEIWVSSPSVASGYWNVPPETSESFGATLPGHEARFLRTGDLGYVRDGSLFITGRRKDVIIIRGANHYPQDIELTVERTHVAVRPGCVAAFSIDRDATEDLAIVMEVDPRRLDGFAEVVDGVRAAVAREHGLGVHTIALLSPRSIPKTSSGKIQRNACREALRAGTLDEIHRAGPATAAIDMAVLGGNGAPVPSSSRAGGMAVDSLCAIVGEVLEVAPDSLDDARPLWAHGLDSLTAEQLSAAIGKHYRVSMPSSVLFETRIGELAEHLSARTTPSRRPPVSVARDAEDLSADLLMGAPVAAPSDRRDVFLTGATGFVGIHVLAELLTRPGGRVWCLVRAPEPAAAKKRIDDALATYRLPKASADRVVPVLGDVRLPRFGLTEELYARVAASIGLIHHVAAEAAWVRPYASMRASNVLGTREVLRLAAASGARVFHASSLAVLPVGEVPEKTLFAEQGPLGDVELLLTGYAQTKWAAEKLVMAARQAGINATICRIPFVWGHSQTGIDQQKDHQLLASIIRGFVDLGAVPAADLAFDALPVDFVARALVGMAERFGDRPATYHLTQPEPLLWRTAADVLVALGYPVSVIPYSSWRRRVLALDDAGAPLFPLRPYFELLDDGRVARIIRHHRASKPYDDRRAAEALGRLGLRAPALTKQMLGRYLSVYRRTDWLPPPNRMAQSGGGG